MELTGTKALVVGGSGLVGTVLLRLLEEQGAETLGTYCTRAVPGLAKLDLTDHAGVAALLEEYRPQIIFLAGGFAGVDRAEAEPDRARAVNEEGTRAVARAARAVGARLVFYSTDYIYDGKAGRTEKATSRRRSASMARRRSQRSGRSKRRWTIT